MAPFLFADAGPGPLFVPIGGSAAVAAFFLTLAVVSAGFWYLKRIDRRAASTWSKWTLILMGMASISSALAFTLIFFGLHIGCGAVAGLIPIIFGAWLIRNGIRYGRRTQQ